MFFLRKNNKYKSNPKTLKEKQNNNGINPLLDFSNNRPSGRIIDVGEKLSNGLQTMKVEWT